MPRQTGRMPPARTPVHKAFLSSQIASSGRPAPKRETPRRHLACNRCAEVWLQLGLSHVQNGSASGWLTVRPRRKINLEATPKISSGCLTKDKATSSWPLAWDCLKLHVWGGSNLDGHARRHRPFRILGPRGTGVTWFFHLRL